MHHIAFPKLYLYLLLLLNSFVSDSLLLAKSTTAFLVGHWHISRKIVSEHLSFSKDEERDSFCEVVAEKNGKLPINAFTWLITHFSRAGDYVVDLFSENASAIISSMKNARHGIFLRKRRGTGACSMSTGLPRSTPPSHGKINVKSYSITHIRFC